MIVMLPRDFVYAKLRVGNRSRRRGLNLKNIVVLFAGSMTSGGPKHAGTTGANVVARAP
ncbi:MAG: hypothetical protein H0W34_01250 [Pyrinomonadaceae bacterium]|nr:hypothetical protein [Pyrinomonadaceae bacterium]